MNNQWINFIMTAKITNMILKKETKTLNNASNSKNPLLIDDEVIQLHKKVITITKEHYFHTFLDLFKDLEKVKSDDSKSVNSKFFNYSNENKIKNALDYLEENISLYEHTKNVIDFSIQCTMNKPVAIKAIVILFAISHDLGKSKSILHETIKNNSHINSQTRHDIVSAIHLKKILIKNKDSDLLEIDHINYLYDVLKNQHSDENINNEIIELFYKADSMAREYELDCIKKADNDN